ncbi:hypothetical protein R3P38DRAFT_3604896 [Favolaschia claudopus]|uniref:Uncharacterized protein n=1 Tax=Favolaschia claudopus TaxID=2862362 RepID=A0AAW0A9V3_9AGAR
MIAVISVVFLLFLGAVRALPLPDRVGVAMGFEASNAESAKVILGVGLILDDSSGRATTKPEPYAAHTPKAIWWLVWLLRKQVIVLKDDAPEVEIQSPTTETVQDTIQDEEPVREEEVPPTPDASIDAATPKPEPEPVTGTTATTPMALSSPNEENLDHLMQISDDENPPEIDITDTVTDPVVLEEPEAQETVGIIEPAVEVQDVRI